MDDSKVNEPTKKKHVTNHRKMALIMGGVFSAVFVALCIAVSNMPAWYQGGDVDQILNGELTEKSVDVGYWSHDSGGSHSSGGSGSTSTSRKKSDGIELPSLPSVSLLVSQSEEETAPSFESLLGVDGDSDTLVARKVMRGADLGVNTRDFDDGSAILDDLLAEVGAVVMSDETTQYKSGMMSRVLFATMDEGNLTGFVKSISDNPYLEIAYRRVEMKDMTEEYEEQKTKVSDAEKRIADTKASLEEKGLSNDERASLESQLEYMESDKKSLETGLEKLEETLNKAEVSIVLQGKVKSSGAGTAQMSRQLFETLSEMPGRVANVIMFILIVLISIMPYALIIGGVAALIWFLHKRVLGKGSSTGEATPSVESLAEPSEKAVSDVAPAAERVVSDDASSDTSDGDDAPATDGE